MKRKNTIATLHTRETVTVRGYMFNLIGARQKVIWRADVDSIDTYLLALAWLAVINEPDVPSPVGWFEVVNVCTVCLFKEEYCSTTQCALGFNSNFHVAGQMNSLHVWCSIDICNKCGCVGFHRDTNNWVNNEFRYHGLLGELKIICVMFVTAWYKISWYAWGLT